MSNTEKAGNKPKRRAGRSDTQRSKRPVRSGAARLVELLRSLPEPATPPGFLPWLKDRLEAFRASSDQEAFAGEFRDELLKNEFMKELLVDALTRWLLLSGDEAGSAE